MMQSTFFSATAFNSQLVWDTTNQARMVGTFFAPAFSSEATGTRGTLNSVFERELDVGWKWEEWETWSVYTVRSSDVE